MSFRQEKTRLQAAVVMSVLFCGLLVSRELSCSKFSQLDSNKMINRGKHFDLLTNSPNQFFKEMYGDQSGEFVCGFWGLKGLAMIVVAAYCQFHFLHKCQLMEEIECLQEWKLFPCTDVYSVFLDMWFSVLKLRNHLFLFIFFQVSGEHVISSTEEYQPPYYEHIEENVYLFDR